MLTDFKIGVWRVSAIEALPGIYGDGRIERLGGVSVTGELEASAIDWLSRGGGANELAGELENRPESDDEALFMLSNSLRICRVFRVGILILDRMSIKEESLFG